MTNRLRRILVALGLMFGAVMVPAVAFATDLEEPTPVGPDAVAIDSVLNLPPYIVSAILGILIPLVTGLLTKLTTPEWVKYGLTSLLAAIAGLLNVSLTDGGGAVISWSAASSAIITWIVALSAYQGWRTVRVTSSMVTTTNADGTVTTEPGKLANIGVK